MTSLIHTLVVGFNLVIQQLDTDTGCVLLLRVATSHVVVRLGEQVWVLIGKATHSCGNLFNGVVDGRTSKASPRVCSPSVGMGVAPAIDMPTCCSLLVPGDPHIPGCPLILDVWLIPGATLVPGCSLVFWAWFILGCPLALCGSLISSS